MISGHANSYFNPQNPEGDLYLISPLKITAASNIKVMGMKDMIIS